MARMASLLGGLLCLGLAGGLASGIARSGFPDRVQTPTSSSPSVLQLVKTRHDFGAVGQMETLDAVFTVVNVGEEPLQFADITKSCTCAHAELHPSRLGPGQQGELHVGWRVGARRGATQESLTILATDTATGLRHVAQVVVAAVVQPEAECDADRINFRHGLVGQVVVRVRPGRKPDCRPLSAHLVSPMPGISVALEGEAVTVSYDGRPLEALDRRRMLTITTNSLLSSVIELPVSVSD